MSFKISRNCIRNFKNSCSTPEEYHKGTIKSVVLIFKYIVCSNYHTFNGVSTLHFMRDNTNMYKHSLIQAYTK